MFSLYRTKNPRFAIFGLGNPGKEYVYTRHNVGYLFLSAFAQKLGCEFNKKQCNSITCYSKEYELILVKPLTFMNMSGVAVKSTIKKYNIEPKNLVVVHDDMDLPFGKVKFQYNRSSAGHKGIESIIEQIKTKEFYRIRIGIGKPKFSNQTIDYVLSELNAQELQTLNKLFKNVSEGLMFFISEDKQKALEFINKIKFIS